MKKWCDKNLVLKSAENQEKVEKYCIKPPLTIKERIERRGKRRAVNWDNEKLDRMLQSDNQLSSNLSEVNIVNSVNLFGSDKQVAKDTLIKWCDNNIEVALNQDKSSQIWKKVERRCLE
ncbi:hypothetical protein A6V39_00535 [Candidatus Mycoplasma haematobovis]|uniref:Uncharacterized protein n=1 Tax=Candidatus Mycoplasma haematobovis TaxID=432608 RepID=A0A1A9QDI3_9MOLU|nr:hypothetical protein [Candidatus Mycoplasma haematobovis]OAL10537.1 hypothetical protein A6V39_00535 [Candidatus Mycoplasma haematobovis]